MSTFEDKVKRLFAQHEELITRKNEPVRVFGTGGMIL